jgi:hypothetical protein
MNRYLFSRMKKTDALHDKNLQWIESIINSSSTPDHQISCEKLVTNFVNNLLFYTLDYKLFRDTEKKLRKLLQKKFTNI